MFLVYLVAVSIRPPRQIDVGDEPVLTASIAESIAHPRFDFPHQPTLGRRHASRPACRRLGCPNRNQVLGLHPTPQDTEDLSVLQKRDREGREMRVGDESPQAPDVRPTKLVTRCADLAERDHVEAACATESHGIGCAHENGLLRLPGRGEHQRCATQIHDAILAAPSRTSTRTSDRAPSSPRSVRGDGDSRSGARHPALISNRLPSMSSRKVTKPVPFARRVTENPRVRARVKSSSRASTSKQAWAMRPGFSPEAS
jgi:hypothetical protein